MSFPDFAAPIGRRAGWPLFRSSPRVTAPAHVWTGRETLVAVLSLLVFAVASDASWALRDFVVPWDSKNHFYPMFQFLAHALQSGTIPLWNPYHFGGHPTAADPQSLLFAPTMVAFALIAPNASMLVFDAVIIAHLLAGGFGMLGLFRRRGWHPVGAVLAGLVFMLGGAASSRLQHTGIILSYSFFPLALWALEVALARKTLWRGAVFAVVACLMAVGRDQVAFLCCVTLIGVLAHTVWTAPDRLGYLRTRAGCILMMALVGALLMVVPALLTMQFLGASNRPGIAYGVAAAGSLAPVNFATLFAPNVFGSLDANYDYWGPGYETVAEADWTDRAVNYLFAGTLPVLLVVWHGIAGGRLMGRGVRLFTGIGVAAILYALGHYTPAFERIFDFMPGVKLYRRPADATFLLNIALAFTSGYLAHRYVERGLPRARAYHPRWVSRGLALAAASCVVIVLTGAITFSLAQSHGAASLLPIATAVLLLGGCAAALTFGERRGRIATMAVLVAFTAAELVMRNAASPLNAEPVSRYSVYAGMTPVEQQGLAALRRDIDQRRDFGAHPRVEVLGLAGPWQNASMTLGLEDTIGYNPLRISDYERAVGPGENAGDPNLRRFPGTFRGYRCTLATLLGLEYLVLDRPLAKLPRHIPRPAATAIYAGDHFYVYKLDRAAPRAYLASKVKSIDTESVIDDHTLPDFDVADEVLIDQHSMSALTLSRAKGSVPGSVQITDYGLNAVRLDVNTASAQVLVLHDLDYPGWRVTVDGVDTPMLRANVLFRGVEVPAGHHLVEFSFHPFAIDNLMMAALHLVRPEGTED